MTDDRTDPRRFDAHPGALAVQASALDLLEGAFDGMELVTERLGGPEGEATVHGLQLSNCSVVSATFGFPVRTFGEVSADRLMLGLPLGAGSGHCNGVPLDPDHIYVYSPGAEHDGGGASPPPFATVSLPVGEVGVLADEFELDIQPGALTVLPSPAAPRLATALRGLVHLLGKGEVPHGAGDAIEAEVFEEVTHALSGAAGAPVPAAGVRIVREAIAVAEDLGPPLRMSGIARELGISDRWIRAAFRDAFDMSPSDFFRTRALHKAHRVLLASEVDGTSVTDVATNLGFWHLGRFSVRYRELFGETPSMTLLRASEYG